MPAAGKQILIYTVTDLNGNTHQVPVEADNGKNATWPEIIKAAQDKGITIGNTPSGYTGNWKAGGSNLNPNDTTTQIDPANPITTDFTKPLKYTVDIAGSSETISVTVKYPETEATWEQIKTEAKAQFGSAFDENLLWKSQPDNKLVSDVKKYPAGTSFTSSASTNAATGGSAERVVTVDQPNRTPQIGDKLYKDPNGKGWIIAKADPSKDGVTGWTLLGHVYDVDTTTGIVSVVSKEIGDARWARQPGAVYNSNGFTNPPLSQKLVGVTNGYDAWREVGGRLEINNGNVVNEGETTAVTS